MGILLIIEIWAFLIVLKVAVRRVPFFFNFGKELTTKEIEHVLGLLPIDYHIDMKRVIIYGYKWQFIVGSILKFIATQPSDDRKRFLLSIIDVLSNGEGHVVCGTDNVALEIIEIYDFNCIKVAQGEIGRVKIVQTLYHEFRHRWQTHRPINVNIFDLEADAFAESTRLVNEYNKEIAVILGHKRTYIMPDTYNPSLYC